MNYKHKTMLRIARRIIKRDYRTQARFCQAHNVDPGNLSNALSGQIPLTPEILEPLGYEKEYIPVYNRIEKE